MTNIQYFVTVLICVCVGVLSYLYLVSSGGDKVVGVLEVLCLELFRIEYGIG